MLISDAILSRTMAVGVGFLLNSISSVMSWSWVARCRFWFFCCCVKLLFRGGRRDDVGVVGPPGAVAADAAGEGESFMSIVVVVVGWVLLEPTANFFAR